MAQYTPMMEQYLEIKKNYKDCLLFFRLGDFYELFFEDAETTSRELEIALTGKSCGQKERAPMCGVPFHSADSYIARLVKKGYKVAICEQTENPKDAKGLVKRDVVRVVTAGTILDANVLDESRNNYIMNIYFSKKSIAMAVADITTGEFFVMEVDSGEENKVIDEIAKFNPSEIIYNLDNSFVDSIEPVFGVKPAKYYQWTYDYENANKVLCEHFKVVNLNGFGLEGHDNLIISAGALMEYFIETQKRDLSHISSIKKQTNDNFMILDLSSRKNLELTETIRDKSKNGSLLWVLDKTVTSMGARLIRKWVERPLVNVDEINNRLESVDVLKQEPISRVELREYLNTIYDLERLMGRVIYKTCNAKDLLNIKTSLENLPHIKNILSEFNSDMLNKIQDNFDCLQDLYELLEESIHEEPPITVREGRLVKDGFNEEIDTLREAKNKGASWLIDLETKEKESTGIKALKVKYNKVFGYFIEVTNSNKHLVPDRYVRKQTISTGERYITEELKKIEETILGADGKIVELEFELFSEIRDKIALEVERVQKTAQEIATIDVLASFAEVAYKNGYVKPTMHDNGIIDIKNGRHPVVELMNMTTFIPNDTFLDTDNNRLSIITGPNMAGKSTYMRQTALLVLMSQIGSFIPVDSAEIGVVDRIFTRVGASDDLATGQSTFMIEMSEVANILNYATRKSLLILDEIGRGTSTFDGLSIAWSVLEYIVKTDVIGARTLFATHYHELTELENKFEGINNYCVSVEEKGDEIVFLHKIIKGAADKSYGIHVAKLAGVPDEVIERANEVLDILTTQDITKNDKTDDDFYYDVKKSKKPSIIINDLTEMFSSMDINNINPIQALNTLNEIREKVIKHL